MKKDSFTSIKSREILRQLLVLRTVSGTSLYSINIPWVNKLEDGRKKCRECAAAVKDARQWGRARSMSQEGTGLTCLRTGEMLWLEQNEQEEPGVAWDADRLISHSKAGFASSETQWWGFSREGHLLTYSGCCPGADEAK